jgi:hypothetical protein
MSKGFISKKGNSTPEKGIRKNEKEEEDYDLLKCKSAPRIYLVKLC